MKYLMIAMLLVSTAAIASDKNPGRYQIITKQGDAEWLMLDTATGNVWKRVCAVFLDSTAKNCVFSSWTKEPAQGIASQKEISDYVLDGQKRVEYVKSHP